jgi:hypothetical protein
MRKSLEQMFGNNEIWSVLKWGTKVQSNFKFNKMLITLISFFLFCLIFCEKFNVKIAI